MCNVIDVVFVVMDVMDVMAYLLWDIWDLGGGRTGARTGGGGRTSARTGEMCPYYNHHRPPVRPMQMFAHVI